MKSLTNLFKSVNTLLNKIDTSKRKETKDKYQEQLQQKLENAITDESWKQDLIRQKQEENNCAAQKKSLQKKLRDTLKNQKKMDYKRKRQDAKFKKLKEQQALSKRLLSDDERNLLLRRKFSQALSNDELSEINKKLSDDKKEQTRRKKLVKKHSADIRNTKRRRKLNVKFKSPNDFVGNVYVDQNDI